MITVLPVIDIVAVALAIFVAGYVVGRFHSWRRHRARHG
jgi:uncharacterized membrane protein